jgi:hypothetical protein
MFVVHVDNSLIPAESMDEACMHVYAYTDTAKRLKTF